jgi:peptidoglycan/LPS O-acetylase OafA/YrhL
MNNEHPKLEHRPDVDGPRAVALLFILAFHASS